MLLILSSSRVCTPPQKPVLVCSSTLSGSRRDSTSLSWERAPPVLHHANRDATKPSHSQSWGKKEGTGKEKKCTAQGRRQGQFHGVCLLTTVASNMLLFGVAWCPCTVRIVALLQYWKIVHYSKGTDSNPCLLYHAPWNANRTRSF